VPDTQRARLAEVLAALSLATDLGAAWPPETALKTCLVGVEVARRLGLGEPEVADVYFLALLRSVACTSFAHEMARAWGDDIAARRLLDPADKADPDGLPSVARALEQGEDRERGARAAAHLLSPAGRAVADQMCLAHRDVGRRFAARLGLGEAVGDGLGQLYERWDGKGMPGPLSGEQIPRIVRVVHVAYVAETAVREGGPAMAVDQVRRRRGGHFDPAVAAALLEDPEASWPRSPPGRSGTRCWTPSPSRGGGSTRHGSTPRWRPSPTSSTSSRPGPSATPTGWRGWPPTPARSPAWTPGRCGSSTGPDWSTTWDGSASPTPSGTSAGG
jgi:HD domain